MNELDIELAEILVDPEQIEALPSDSKLVVIGELERLKARVWVDLAKPKTNSSTGNPDKEKLLKADEVADILGVPKDYVYDLTRRGEIKSIRFGKHVRFQQKAIQAWIEQHQEGHLQRISTSRRLKKK